MINESDEFINVGIPSGQGHYLAIFAASLEVAFLLKRTIARNDRTDELSPTRLSFKNAAEAWNEHACTRYFSPSIATSEVSRDDRPCKAIEGEFASSFSAAICTGADNRASENAKRATASKVTTTLRRPRVCKCAEAPAVIN